MGGLLGRGVKGMIYVLGDCFVDRYWIGETERLSPEAPIPVVRHTHTTIREGGAANVAKNIESLGGDVKLVNEVSTSLWPVKNRLMVGDYQLARWDENDVCKESVVGSNIREASAVVIADYCKGAITDTVINKLGRVVAGKRVYIDTKGDPDRFDPLCGALEVTMFPNLKEYEQYHSQYTGFSEWGTVVLKKGKDGIALIRERRIEVKLPAWNNQATCTIGAGDTVMAAYVVAEQEKMSNPLEWANKAAGLVVGKRYTSTVSRDEWLR